MTALWAPHHFPAYEFQWPQRGVFSESPPALLGGRQPKPTAVMNLVRFRGLSFRVYHITSWGIQILSVKKIELIGSQESETSQRGEIRANFGLLFAVGKKKNTARCFFLKK